MLERSGVLQLDIYLPFLGTHVLKIGMIIPKTEADRTGLSVPVLVAELVFHLTQTAKGWYDSVLKGVSWQMCGVMIQYWKAFHGKCAVSPTDLFTLPPQLGMRGHCFKIFHPRSQTDVRRRSFSVRGVRLWNFLPEHVVTEPNYKTLKVLLAEALGDALYDFH